MSFSTKPERRQTGAKTNLTPTRGRAPQGERVPGSAPAGAYRNTTLISAIGPERVVGSLVVEGAADTNVFATYLERILLPELSAGDVIVLDNLNVHRSPRVRNLCEAAGVRLLFLPPYSPDLNPIERMFSKLKTALRRLAARTADDLLNAFATALASITADDIRHWFESALRMKSLVPLL